ncbi:MAG: hypothetical protein QME96_07380 [Myxococcota bacterium]|nr:hypothetical protein [Myxococcota bacterium]
MSTNRGTLVVRRAVVALCILAAASCGDESSVTTPGPVPYRLQVRILDRDGAPLPATGGAAAWSLAMPGVPVLEIEYWSERAVPPGPLVVRAVGASLAAGAADAESEPLPESEVSFDLAMIDTTHRTLRLAVEPPSSPGPAVFSATLGGAAAYAAIEFAPPEADLAAPATGVADGATEVTVEVAGVAGQVITLQTTLGRFTAPFDDATAALALFPVRPGEAAGAASVGLVSDAPGAAFVSVAGAPAEQVRIDFERVRIEIGDPVPVGFLPGAVVHEVCVAANTATGAVDLMGGSIGDAVLDPAYVPVIARGASPPEACPAGDFAGHALFRWAVDGDVDLLTATWTSRDETVSATASKVVEGTVFEGYDATLDFEPLGTGDTYLVILRVALSYLPAGGLDGRIAPGIGVTFLVFSAFGAVELSADEETGPGGMATAIYEVEAGDVLQVFLLPDGGSTIYLGEAW